MSDLITKKLEETPDLLSIGEVSKLFNLHPDTLRNWERSGELVPLRVGPRKDRKYRKADIEIIVAKMGSKLTLAQLEQFLWRSADILRGKIDSSDYKKYIFGLLFYKRISDVWDEEYKKVMDEYDDKTLAEADYNHRFQVPRDCRWSVISETSENIGQKLNDIFDMITNVNSPKLDKIFDDLDFANKDRFPNETLQRLINHFSQYNFGSNYISSDLLGDAYEYLIKQFAADAGKKGGEFYTPREVERIIIGIVKPHQKDHIYDPTVGSGGFLLEAYNYLKGKSGEQIARTLYLYGQEINISTFAIAKINMFLHGLDSADIRRGDTLVNPQFLNQIGNLQTFDIVVANPPYSIKDYEWETFKTDKFGRTEGYDLPPQKNADFAFILHIIKSLNTNGRAGVVLPHGVLFRGGSEGRIREQIIKNDLLEAVIGLPPKLFYGTGIPAAILIFNKNKSQNKQGKVLIVDAERDFLEGKNQSVLRKQDIEKILKAYDEYKDIDKYAKVVDLKEIENKEFNLDVRKYVNSSKVTEKIDIHSEWNFVKTIENSRNKSLLELSKFFDNLKTNSVSQNKWKRLKLTDLTEFIRDGTHGTHKDVLNGIPLLSAKDIVDGKILLDNNPRRISKDDYNSICKKYEIEVDDILLTIVGTIGRTALVKEVPSPFTVQRSVAIIRVKKDIIYPEYCYQFFQSDFFQDALKEGAHGLAQAGVYLNELAKKEVIVPPLDIQMRITSVLSNMDMFTTQTSEIVSKNKLVKKGLMRDIFNQKIQID